MAAEFARRGWGVVGTVRGNARTELHELADACPDRVEVQTLDIADPEAIAALRARLSARSFDVLFVNAGTTNANQGETIADVSTEEFVRVMLTNVLGVMRTVEVLAELVRPDGLLGVMSSGFSAALLPRYTVLVAQQGRPGLRFVDRDRNVVPW